MSGAQTILRQGPSPATLWVDLPGSVFRFFLHHVGMTPGFTKDSVNPDPDAVPMSLDRFLASVHQVGVSTGTDKITTHRYDLVYGQMLQTLAELDSFAILEIGYGSGAGIKFWNSLFPQAFVYCLDRDHGDFEGERFCVLRADQSVADDLCRAMSILEHPIQLIIDDGSHFPEHQLLSFSILFKDLLEPGGVYVVEDIETSYWRRGILYGNAYSHGLGERRSMVEASKLLVDFINRRFLDPDDINLLCALMLDIGIDPEAASLIETMNFGLNAITFAKFRQSSCHVYPVYPHLKLTSRRYDLNESMTDHGGALHVS